MSAVWFIAKKLISRLLFPVGQVLLLWLLGVLVWWRRPHRRLGPLLMLAAGLWLLVLSMPLTGALLLHGLELRNYHYATPSELLQRGVNRVVVLSGGISPGPESPADRLSPPTLKRLWEGVSLWKRMPGAKLVLTGGGFFGPNSEARLMADLAREMGVPPQEMILETASWDTDDQARRLRAVLGQRPFALVTSATHMPRSLLIFRAYGLHPLAAPADFRTKGMQVSIFSFVPQALGLKASEDAVYEYLGLAWLRLKQALGWLPQGAEQ